jgi:hypothetical protein
LRRPAASDLLRAGHPAQGCARPRRAADTRTRPAATSSEREAGCLLRRSRRPRWHMWPATNPPPGRFAALAPARIRAAARRRSRSSGLSPSRSARRFTAFSLRDDSKRRRSPWSVRLGWSSARRWLQAGLRSGEPPSVHVRAGAQPALRIAGHWLRLTACKV